MVQQAVDLNGLDRQVIAFLKAYSFEREAVIRYLSTFLSLSAPVDLYTSMLNKPERYREGDTAGEGDAYQRLAQLVLTRLGGSR
jgi:hypothetical protein